MSRKAAFLAVIVCFCLLLGLRDLTSQGSWQVFTKKDGLPSNSITSVFEDAVGNVWCATLNSGVARYDGRAWKVFDKKDGLIANSINLHYVDSMKNVWFVRNVLPQTFLARDGLTKYDGQKLDTWGKSFSPTLVRQIFEDSAGTIWLCTNHGLAYWKSSSGFMTLSEDEELAGSDVLTIFEDSGKRLWVGTTSGIWAYNGTKWEIFDDTNGATSESVVAILEDKQGGLWFGTKGGIFRFNGKDWRSYTEDNGLPVNDVLMMKMDSKGRIWTCFGTDQSAWGIVGELLHRSGIVQFEGEKLISFSEEEGAPSSKVIRLHIDSRDNIWCDTFTFGIYRYDGTAWSAYKKRDGFYVDHFTGFAEDRNGHIWLSTDSGVLCFDRKNWTHYTKKDGLPSNNATCVMEDSRGELWIGTMGGLARHSRLTAKGRNPKVWSALLGNKAPFQRFRSK